MCPCSTGSERIFTAQEAKADFASDCMIAYPVQLSSKGFQDVQFSWSTEMGKLSHERSRGLWLRLFASPPVFTNLVI